MDILFINVDPFETDCYHKVGREMRSLGWTPRYVTLSRVGADHIEQQGEDVVHFPSFMEEARRVEPSEEKVATIEKTYNLRSVRDLYVADRASAFRSEDESLALTVRYFAAWEAYFDRHPVDCVVPEIGAELIRRVGTVVARHRGITTFFLYNTFLPNPLRLYVNKLNYPIVPPEAIRPLSPEESRTVEMFIQEAKQRRATIMPHRLATISPKRFRKALQVWYRDTFLERGQNEHYRFHRILRQFLLRWGRRHIARPFYSPLPKGRRFVFFPLQVSDDFKTSVITPHCQDQLYLATLIAKALPAHITLVVKEHPVAIGRTPLSVLRGLARIPNLIMVSPFVNAHQLIAGAELVVTASSTVGFEALMYEKPVVTLARPFYSGYGLTIDVDNFADLPEAIKAAHTFQVDRNRLLPFFHAAMQSTLPGKPMILDPSYENARLLAKSLHARAMEVLEPSASTVPIDGPTASQNHLR